MTAAPDNIEIGGKAIPVWPEGQGIRGRGDNVIAMTQFTDTEAYHPGLIAKCLALYEDSSVKRMVSPSASGTKIHMVEEWDLPEARLLTARVLAFFQRVFRQPQGFIHISWVNITRTGEYSMPHTHPDCSAVAVYALDAGDPNPSDPMDGQLAFVDPRYDACCRTDKNFMTTPFSPRMPPGSMIIFPSSLVHCVNPYAGNRPRLTFSFDLNSEQRGRARVLDELDQPAADATGEDMLSEDLLPRID